MAKASKTELEPARYKKEKEDAGGEPLEKKLWKAADKLRKNMDAAEYITNRSFDDPHFKDMILEYLKKFGETKRKAIDALIMPKLSTVLTDEQKKAKVSNMLSALRMQEKIKITAYATWVLA